MKKWELILDYDPIRYLERVDVLICKKSANKGIKYASFNITGKTISELEIIVKKLEKAVYG